MKLKHSDDFHILIMAMVGNIGADKTREIVADYYELKEEVDRLKEEKAKDGNVLLLRQKDRT